METLPQIPIYRAKKTDSDEYVEGFYYPVRCIGTDKTSPSIASSDLEDPEYDDYFEIDTTKIAIHFPDMIDSEGTKIFASLSEDGKGGDTIINKYTKAYGAGLSLPCIFTTAGVYRRSVDSGNRIPRIEYREYIVTGIQE